MLLYHGSLEKVEVPVLDKSKESNDFGKGFYLTSSYEQAKRWAVRHSGTGIINEYLYLIAKRVTK